MDSGTLADANLREKLRWGDGKKVYTRKFPQRKTQTLNLDNPSNQNLENGSVKEVVSRVDDRVKINLAAATSKNEVGKLRKDLLSELDQVRVLFKKVEDKEVQLTDAATDVAVERISSDGGEERRVLDAGDMIERRDSARMETDVIPANDVVERRDFMRMDSEVIPVNDVVDRRDLARMSSDVNSASGFARMNPELNSVGDAIERRGFARMNSDVNSATDVIERRGFTRMHSDLNSATDVMERRDYARMNSDMGPRPFRQLTVSVAENNHGMGEYVEKEKRTPKVNQHYRNSDFLLAKDRLPSESNKKHKSNGGRKHGRDMELYDRYRNRAFKSCESLLQKLMKHKHGWVFNEPVNAKALGLHDYHDIIQHPMDLGTVKSRLAQNFYKSPREFAQDVRLTFHNAMTYNPQGQDVHVMAEQLLTAFEERWTIIEVEFNPDQRFEMISDAGLTTPTSRKVPQMRNFNRSESMTMKPSNLAPVRTPAPKKPKARDPNKRDMTFDEKQKLSTNLQNLPSEKLDNIVQIIKKCNSALCQHDDEIEVDIDSVNAETLWELDRFVTNYKKSLSKIKRKAEIAQARAKAAQAIAATNPVPPSNPEVAPKENRTDENNGATTSPVQREKQGENVSGSSSSSSSSSGSGSSSSDSDSDSSSADGSEAGQSPRP